MKIHRVGAEVLPAGRKDGQTADDANTYSLFETFLFTRLKTVKNVHIFKALGRNGSKFRPHITR